MTLFEMMVALVVAGILSVGAVAGWAKFADRVAVEQAQGTVLNAYRRAQSAARAWGRPSEVTVTPDSIVVRTMGISDTVVVWQGPGPARAGVALTPASHSAAYGPNGIAIGAANVSHVLQRGSIRRTVVVSRLGRVRVR